MENTAFTRQVAEKVTLNEIQEGSLNSDEQGMTWLEIRGKKISRVNVAGVILQKENVGSTTNLLIDDGTATAMLRFFEKTPLLDEISVGETMLVVGKVRSFHQEKYISPELGKKIAPLWLKIRTAERKFLLTTKTEDNVATPYKNTPSKEMRQDISEREVEEKLPRQKILELIQEKDQGSGALIQEVIEQSPLKDTEEILERMLERGEVFQISPGRVKVL